MSKTQQNEERPSAKSSAHRGGIVEVLRKVVPFLFRKKKTAAHISSITSEPRPAVHRVSHPTMSVKHHRKKSHLHPKASLPSMTVRKNVTDTSTVSASSDMPAAPPSALAEIQSDSEPKGALIVPTDKEAPEPTKTGAIASALLQEEGWMQKIAKTANIDIGTTVKHGNWRMLFDRFSFGSKKADVTIKKSAPAMTEKDMRQDSFLSRVQQKKESSVVGTAVDDERAPSQLPGVGERTPAKQSDETSALEGFAGGEAAPASKIPGKTGDKEKIISAAELKTEAEKTMKKEEPKKEAAPAEDTPTIHINIHANKSSVLTQILAGISHFGLGKESLQFIQNLSTMLNAGLPLIDGIRTLQEETRNKPMKAMLARILTSVENGSPFWRALDAENFFSLHALALIRIGEEAGNLAQNMEYLAIQEEKDHELKSKVTMAMIYPSIVLSIMFVIVMGLGLFVLPNLIGVLTSLNAKLPLTTQLLIEFTNLFTKYAAVVVPGSVISIIVFVILSKYTRLKTFTQWVQFKIPGMGSLARESTIARFGVILGGLLRAGVPVVEAVQSLVEVTGIVAYRNMYEKLLEHITIGDSFAKSFAAIKGSTKLLPPSVQQLVITGEKSGALATIMLKIADIYDKKASETAQKLPVILEPMILLIIGGLVGTIAFSVIVPIYSIVGNVGH